MNIDYELLGCPECRFADQKSIKTNEPCCTHWQGPLPTIDGSCARMPTAKIKIQEIQDLKGKA